MEGGRKNKASQNGVKIYFMRLTDSELTSKIIFRKENHYEKVFIHHYGAGNGSFS